MEFRLRNKCTMWRWKTSRKKLLSTQPATKSSLNIRLSCVWGRSWLMASINNIKIKALRRFMYNKCPQFSMKSKIQWLWWVDWGRREELEGKWRKKCRSLNPRNSLSSLSSRIAFNLNRGTWLWKKWLHRLEDSWGSIVIWNKILECSEEEKQKNLTKKMSTPQNVLKYSRKSNRNKGQEKLIWDLLTPGAMNKQETLPSPPKVHPILPLLASMSQPSSQSKILAAAGGRKI